MRFSARASCNEVWVRSAHTFHSFYGPLNGGFIPISHWDGEREAECIIIPPFLLDRLTSRNPKSRRLLLRWRKKKKIHKREISCLSRGRPHLFSRDKAVPKMLSFLCVCSATTMGEKYMDGWGCVLLYFCSR